MNQTIVTCSDCKYEFALEDAKWCRHCKETGAGSKECPNCSSCICKGNTYDDIVGGFEKKVQAGKMKRVKGKAWQYECITARVTGEN